MSQFVVNGEHFDSDFEAALYIVVKSDQLTVGSFYDEAVAEQRRLAQMQNWKLALLEDDSLQIDADEDSGSVSEKRFSTVAAHPAEKRLRRHRSVTPISTPVEIISTPEVSASAAPVAKDSATPFEPPSAKSILNAVQKVRGSTLNNRICPDCKLEGTEWVHENAVLYICYNASCQELKKTPLERIVGWRVKDE